MTRESQPAVAECTITAMSAKHFKSPDGESANPQFATTRWSLVLEACRAETPQANMALESLCRAYWFPLYAYIRRRVADAHTAQDLTQAFFEYLLEKGTFAVADPDRGRFRSFLLKTCERFLLNEWQKAKARKRGGGRLIFSLDFADGEQRYESLAVDRRTPQHMFEQQWAITLLAGVLQRLKDEFAMRGKQTQFEILKNFVSGTPSADAYQEAGLTLDMSVGAVKVAAHRLRARYRELLRAEIAQTVERDADVDDEIRNLFAVLGAMGH